MRGRQTGGAWVLGIVLALANGAAQAVVIDVGSATGAPGDLVSIDVGLSVEGSAVLATQNRIDFTRQAFVAARGDGVPDCRVNPDIDKNATAFRFLPIDCDPAVDCSGVRAFVLAFDNLDPIADGSRLYSCNVRIAADAAAGAYPLANTELGASAAAGVLLPTTGSAGEVTVVPPPVARVVIGSGGGQPGDTVQVGVALSLLDPAAEVAGVQADVAFDPVTPVRATAEGRPDCTVTDAVAAGIDAFAFLPVACTPGSDCTAVRALVFSPTSTEPIPDATVLFSCAVAIAANAPIGDYPLVAGELLGSDPDGGALSLVGVDGAITVAVPPPAACAGDCDASGDVSINELLLGVNILVGNAGPAQCPAMDVNGDGAVAVNELVQAVNVALGACPQ